MPAGEGRRPGRARLPAGTALSSQSPASPRAVTVRRGDHDCQWGGPERDRGAADEGGRVQRDPLLSGGVSWGFTTEPSPRARAHGTSSCCPNRAGRNVCMPSPPARRGRRHRVRVRRRSLAACASAPATGSRAGRAGHGGGSQPRGPSHERRVPGLSWARGRGLVPRNPAVGAAHSNLNFSRPEGTTAKAPMHAVASGRRGDLDLQLPLAGFAIKTQEHRADGPGRMPCCIDRGRPGPRPAPPCVLTQHIVSTQPASESGVTSCGCATIKSSRTFRVSSSARIRRAEHASDLPSGG